jgi:putative transposase
MRDFIEHHLGRRWSPEQISQAPSPEDCGEAEVARDRVTQGVPFSDGLRAFRRALSAIRDPFIAEATQRGLDLGLVIDRTTCLWELADVARLQIARSIGRRRSPPPCSTPATAPTSSAECSTGR